MTPSAEHASSGNGDPEPADKPLTCRPLEMVCRFGADGLRTYVSPSYCASFGVPAAELLGRDALDRLPEADRATVTDALAELSPELPSTTVEHRIVDPAGGPRWLARTLHALFDGEGRLLEYLSVARDITRERELEERLVGEDRLASIGRLTAGIVHELNNPIGAILLAAQSALRSLDSSDDREMTREALELVESEAMRCGRIVKSVVSFTRGGPSGPGRVDEAAANARQLTRKYAAGFGVDVDLEIPTDLPEVAASQTAVEQLIVTLIRGAAETPGVSRVTVAAQHAGALVHVSVSEIETAGGAPIRQDADLTILGELIARLGGKLRIDACTGGGTRVTVDLPVAVSQSSGQARGVE